MNLRMLTSSLVILILTMGQVVVGADETGPAGDIPQLQVLSGYAGPSKLQVLTESMRQITGAVEGKWTLEGRFLEQTIVLRTPDQGEILTLRTIMTYDTKTGQYRQWQFNSQGQAYSGDGTWNAQAKQMTWSSSQDGRTIRTVADFSRPEESSWTVTVLQASGQTELEIRGTNTRVK